MVLIYLVAVSSIFLRAITKDDSLEEFIKAVRGTRNRFAKPRNVVSSRSNRKAVTKRVKDEELVAI